MAADPPEELIHFEAIDPRGFRVLCLQTCWFNHILDEHFEMTDEEADVISAIQDPNPPFIFQDVGFPKRHVYYRRLKSTDYLIKVIVDFSNADYGEIITAFKTDSGKKGEKILWPPLSD
jgi:hypothetical protein